MILLHTNLKVINMFTCKFKVKTNIMGDYLDQFLELLLNSSAILVAKTNDNKIYPLGVVTGAESSDAGYVIIGNVYGENSELIKELKGEIRSYSYNAIKAKLLDDGNYLGFNSKFTFLLVE